MLTKNECRCFFYSLPRKIRARNACAPPPGPSLMLSLPSLQISTASPACNAWYVSKDLCQPATMLSAGEVRSEQDRPGPAIRIDDGYLARNVGPHCAAHAGGQLFEPQPRDDGAVLAGSSRRRRAMGGMHDGGKPLFRTISGHTALQPHSGFQTRGHPKMSCLPMLHCSYLPKGRYSPNIYQQRREDRASAQGFARFYFDERCLH